MAGGKTQTPRNLDADLAEIELALRSLPPRQPSTAADLSPRMRLRWMFAGRATLAAGIAIPLLGHVSPRQVPAAAKKVPPMLREEAARPVPVLPSFVREADVLAAGPGGSDGRPWTSPSPGAERPELTATGSISAPRRNVAER